MSLDFSKMAQGAGQEIRGLGPVYDVPTADVAMSGKLDRIAGTLEQVELCGLSILEKIDGPNPSRTKEPVSPTIDSINRILGLIYDRSQRALGILQEINSKI